MFKIFILNSLKKIKFYVIDLLLQTIFYSFSEEIKMIQRIFRQAILKRIQKYRFIAAATF